MSTTIDAGAIDAPEYLDEKTKRVGRDIDGFWYVAYNKSGNVWIAKSTTNADVPVAWTTVQIDTLLATLGGDDIEMIVINSGGQLGIHLMTQQGGTLYYTYNPTGDIGTASAWFDLPGGSPSAFSSFPSGTTYKSPTMVISGIGNKQVHLIYIEPVGVPDSQINSISTNVGMTAWGTEKNVSTVALGTFGADVIATICVVDGFIHLFYADATNSVFTYVRMTYDGTGILTVTEQDGTGGGAIPQDFSAVGQDYRIVTKNIGDFSIADIAYGNGEIWYIVHDVTTSGDIIYRKGANGANLGAPVTLTAVTMGTGFDVASPAGFGNNTQMYIIGRFTDGTMKIIDALLDTLLETTVVTTTLADDFKGQASMGVDISFQHPFAISNSLDFFNEWQSFTDPGGVPASYGQSQHMGNWIGESEVLVFIRAQKWDSTGDGLGTPQAGMAFFDTTLGLGKVYDGSNWVAMLPVLTGVVNPDTVVTGSLGQIYRDTSGLVWYICNSNPTGTAWQVM